MLRGGMKDLPGFMKHNSEQGDKEESDRFVNCFGDTQMLNDNLLCFLSENYMPSFNLVRFILS